MAPIVALPLALWSLRGRRRLSRKYRQSSRRKRPKLRIAKRYRFRCISEHRGRLFTGPNIRSYWALPSRAGPPEAGELASILQASQQAPRRLELSKTEQECD